MSDGKEGVREANGGNSGSAFLFSFWERMEKEKLLLIFDDKKQHFLRVPGNATPWGDHLGKAKTAHVRS